MRLLMTTDTVGGVWSFTRDLTEELLERGHSVALVSFGREPSEAQQAWCEAETAAYGDCFLFTPARVPLEWMQNNECAFTAGEQVLRSAAEQFQADVLLTNQFCFGATTLRLPRVMVAHSDVLSWARACKPSALTPSPWLNHYTSLVQGGVLRANAVVAPTHWMLQALTRNFFLPLGGKVIPNGCRVAESQTAAPRKLQAVSAGRLWDEAKGLDILLTTELDLPVLIAGDTQFEGEAAPDFPGANVTLPGPISTGRLQEIFRESALYLCTSRYEPFGLAPVEAALCGCAVIARDLPSLREVWGDDALYFHDAADLAAQVRRLVNDPEALAEAQRRSRQRATQYSVGRMADRYLALLDSVLLQQKKAMPHVA